MLPVITLKAEAHSDNGGYPYNVAPTVYIADKWGFFQCECTSFVAYCLNVRNGFNFRNDMYGQDYTNKWGDAKHWGSVARLHNIAVDSTPTVGAVAWASSGTYGHVAWVCAVNGDYVTIDEYNYGEDGRVWDSAGQFWHGNHRYNTRTVHKSAFQYIHFPGSSTPSQPSVDLGNEFYAYICYPHGNLNISNATSSDLTDNHYGNVQTAVRDLYDPRQIWHFFRQTDGTYKIVSMYDGRCLDISGGHLVKDTNVGVWRDTGEYPERWRIVEGQHCGYYNIVTAGSSNFALDVYNTQTVAGANVQIYDNHGWQSQTFDIEYISWPEIKDRLAYTGLGDGFYSRITYNGSHLQTTGTTTYQGQAMDVRLTTATANDPRQIWYFQRQSDKSYKIINEYSGWCLDVESATVGNNKNIWTWYINHNNSPERWFMTHSPGDSRYRLISGIQFPYALYSINIPGGNTYEGANVTLYQPNANAWQMFNIAPINYTKPSAPTVPTNIYVNGSPENVLIRWSSVPEKSTYDSREYQIILRGSDGGIIKSWRQTGTSYTYQNLPVGRYSVSVRAINTKYPSSSSNYASAYNTRSFDVISPIRISLTASPAGGRQS